MNGHTSWKGAKKGNEYDVRNHEERLEELGMVTLEERMLQVHRDMLQVYKILNGKDKMSGSDTVPAALKSARMVNAFWSGRS